MKTHYSCAELAALKLPAYPTTKVAWLALVKREDWPQRPRAARGGGAEYAPPARILKLIAAHLTGAPISLTARAGREIAITLDVTVGEAVGLLRWLEKRRAHRG